MDKTYVVELTVEERKALIELVSKGSSSARVLRRAHMVLMSADGKSDEVIVEIVHVNPMTVRDTRVKWCTERLSRGLSDQPQGRPVHKLDGKQEAYLVALACSDAPEGRQRWTLQMLADKLLELEVIEEPISYETVRHRLKKTS